MLVLQVEREKMGLTQEEAAKSIGISISTLQKLERGYRAGSDSTKRKVADFYNQSVGFLFFNEKITKRDNRKEAAK